MTSLQNAVSDSYYQDATVTYYSSGPNPANSHPSDGQLASQSLQPQQEQQQQQPLIDHQTGSPTSSVSSHSTAYYESVPPTSIPDQSPPMQHQQYYDPEEEVDASSPPAGEPAEQPFYVNAKQYHRILKRRIARAKLEENLKIARRRKPYDVLRSVFVRYSSGSPVPPWFLTAAEIAEKERLDKLKELENQGQNTEGAANNNNNNNNSTDPESTSTNDTVGGSLDNLAADQTEGQVKGESTQEQRPLSNGDSVYHVINGTAEHPQSEQISSAQAESN
ncbi:HAP2 [[Candida] subhashii]|uniref:Transcriptional activator HAP2 n=1 Tax=[Candida] subhashii TaxID=561895 RepID=A0A8J5QRQ3_9ASCO|nr:HAP2 [[Candida] subhashii]KAG7665471.1 HAP2 [[Candida] subhashii]